MKSIEQIRSHIHNLRVCQVAPCGCKGTIHADACQRGLVMMEVAIQNLRWAIGENEELQEQVDSMARDVATMTRSN